MVSGSDKNDSQKRSRPLLVYVILAVAAALTIGYWSDIAVLGWYWKVIIGLGYLVLVGMTLRRAPDGDHEQIEIERATELMRIHRYRHAEKVIENALRRFPESQDLQALHKKCGARISRISAETAAISSRAEREQAVAELTATARRIGATVVDEGGRVVSGRRAERTCEACDTTYVEGGLASPQERAIGGALCRSCGNFYCEPCVSRALLRGSNNGSMTCACGKSQVNLGSDGSAAMRNFQELVVFRRG